MADLQKKRRPNPDKKENTAPTQEVAYIPPAPINRRQLILILLSIAAVALAVFLGLSIFFRVDKEACSVSGNRMYDAATIWEASGIQDGESLLSFGKARAAGRIKQKLPYVKSVRIGITLPNKVTIVVEELDVVYAAQDGDDNWWLLTSDGRILEKTTAEEANKKTLLQGFRLKQPKVGQKAEAVELEPGATDDSGNPIVVTITNTERMETALEIATELEHNEILGDIASIQVENMGDIQLWYGSQYQVKLGEPGQMKEKIAFMNQMIAELDSHDSGVLDVSFSAESNKGYYYPF